MATVDRTQAGTEGEASGEPHSLAFGQDRFELGPSGPLIRALGIGFALGLVVMTLVALLSD